MNFFEGVSSAFSNVYSHKLRSILTMLGIIIGISSVIMITGVGEGVKNSVFSIVSAINRNFVQVYYRGGEPENYLRLTDIAVISSIPNVDKVSGISEWWGMNLKLRIPGEVEEGSILGVDQNYSVLEKVEILKGRFISANDVENRSMVAVIKPSTAFKVFGRVDCLGEKIEMETYNGTQEFTVIGILDEGESNVLTQMMSTPLLRTLAVVPVTTVLEIFNYEDIIDFYGVSMHDNLKTVETSEDIRNLLNMSHGTTDDYQVESMSTQFEQIDAILNGITGFIAFVAAISLFVGGVGVMNIMLVTVRERTREIGIRKSLGATRGVIRIQFLLEAAILTVLGGIIGLILGAVGAQGIGIILTSLMGTTVTPVVSPFAVSLAIGVSTLVGIVFGVYPAGKAAKLDPVEALRYE